MVEVKEKRKYSSTVRDEQAVRTRGRILDAASELFLERGYARTTMKDIAERADVARDTVHAIFGNKARVLTALIDVRLVPDAGVDNITQRPDALAIKDEPDQRKQIELFANFIAGISPGIRPVFEILRTASAVEPEMAKVFEEMDRYRMINMQTYVKWIAARGPLRVNTRRAGEIIWAIASPDVSRMLCEEIGWSESQHARWLADTLIRTLLPDD
ncbi:MAG TPA: helix-turn-helix domain-containing protein [Propionibacteriaceae bacterium]|nr:helix-turn-helix domain-containing protein [Propionibacteriaceae bacterium]